MAQSTPDAYELMEEIGAGSFASVHRIRRKADGRILVWKEIRYGNMNDREKQQLVAEVNILRELRHPNIVRYYDRVIDKQRRKIFVVMEYCEHGDLGSVVKANRKHNDAMPEDTVWKIFTQIVQALHECHTRLAGKILHRDLKPSNVLIDAQHQVKLGDFGLARMMGEGSEFCRTQVGTPYYKSPEQVAGAWYNEKSDIWSTGCLLYEMTTNVPPFVAESHVQLAMRIRQGLQKRIPRRYSEELQRVIAWCLEQEPDRRPTTEDLLKVPIVSVRVKEWRLREHHTYLKQQREELRRREEALEERERKVALREAAVGLAAAGAAAEKKRPPPLVNGGEDGLLPHANPLPPELPLAAPDSP